MVRAAFAAVLAALLALAAPARAQVSDDVVKIGVLTDMSSLYSDINGQGAVVATQMAIDEAGGNVPGKKIELVQADVQNKPDVAVSTAGRWYDADKVDVILGTGASSSSIATMGVAGQKKKIYLATDPASSDITGKLCNPYTVHWVYDTAALGQRHRLGGGQSRRQAVVLPDRRLCLRLRPGARCDRGGQGQWRRGDRRRAPPDQHLGLLLLPVAGAGVQGAGHRPRQCRRRHVNSIKQAAEFGIVKGGQKLAGLLVFVTDVHSIGLPLANGLNLTEAFYWDQDDKTRAFAKRFGEKRDGRMPTSIQAGFYSATKRYIDAVKATGTDDADKVMANMKAGRSTIRSSARAYIRPDGRNVHDMYLFEVKTPAESKGPVGLLQADPQHPRRRSLPPDGAGRMPDGEKRVAVRASPPLVSLVAIPG